MKHISEFVSRFKTSINLDESFVVSKSNRYFLLNEGLKKLIQKDFFYAGVYLGKVKQGIFFPSFILLSAIAEGDANKIIVDKKTAWLFICGRDVFRRGIVRVSGSPRKGDYSLVINEHNECLGFGKIVEGIGEERDNRRVVVKNIADIGDFLRRERH